MNQTEQRHVFSIREQKPVISGTPTDLSYQNKHQPSSTQHHADALDLRCTPPPSYNVNSGVMSWQGGSNNDNKEGGSGASNSKYSLGPAAFVNLRKRSLEVAQERAKARKTEKHSSDYEGEMIRLQRQQLNVLNDILEVQKRRHYTELELLEVTKEKLRLKYGS